MRTPSKHNIPNKINSNSDLEFLFVMYYFLNLAIGFVIYGFWAGIGLAIIPIAPFVYLVDRFLRF